MLPARMLPDELKARAQWVVWRSEKRRDKVTKVPYIPGTTRRARSNDASTWRTFEEAMASCRQGGFDGVSYAFSADDGFTGIDLDHCAGDYGVEIIIKAFDYDHIIWSGFAGGRTALLTQGWPDMQGHVYGTHDI